MRGSWRAFLSIVCKFLVSLTGLMWSVPVMGQQPLCKWFETAASADSIYVKLDSLTALENSISISGKEAYQWHYNSNSGMLTVYRGEGTFSDSLQVCYRRFPYELSKTYAHRTLASDYDSMAYFKKVKAVEGEVYDFREEIFPSGKLNKSGSLTRGVSFGNTQNVFVNSALNLQMDGQLTDDLFIRASITDQNVPFQPQGNTQQVQDFDNVLVELYNDDFSLKAGDVVFRERNSTFLRYYKNVQGLQMTTDYNMGDKWKASTQVGASIAKGKFNSVQLDVKEGVLGPYRIPGPDNERYIIVMANSERVFLDGKLLKRGFNHDYIIDYNQGQVTFTTNVLITQYSRVRIDYEYSERNFSRSILTANHIQEHEKATFYVNYYKEQDNRNRPLFDEYTEEDKLLLAAVGDDINAAAVPRVDSVAFDPQRILYRKVALPNPQEDISHYYILLPIGLFHHS